MSQGSIFSRRPALLALLLYMAGILFSLSSGISYHIPLLLTVISLFGTVVSYQRSRLGTAAYMAAALVLLLGWYMTSFSVGPQPPNHISNLAMLVDRTQVIGTIVEEADVRPDRTFLVMETDSISVRGTWVPTVGRLRARIMGEAPPAGHSDYVRMTGYLYNPSGARNPYGFDYGAYLRFREIYAALSVASPGGVVVLKKGGSMISRVVSPVRDFLLGKTQKYLSPQAAAILSGFVLGEQQEISEEHKELFRRTGTMHLMAVSGSNVGIVLILFSVPLTLLHLPRKAKVVILLGIVFFFAMLTRLQPSVVRASIMASVGLVAYGWIKKPDYINLLCFSGLIMLLWKPLQLFDVGLQLSFAATFALVYAAPKAISILAFLQGRWLKWLHWVGVAFLSTLAAQLAVMPLMAHYFQRVPISGIVANLPVGVLAAVSSMAGIGFYICSPLGGWITSTISVLIEFLVRITVATLGFFSSLPRADVKTAVPSWHLIFLYWLILYSAWEFVAKRRLSKRGLIAALAFLNFAIWHKVLTPEPEWTLEFLDVGRNRAWLFSSQGKTLAGFDSFESQDDADKVIMPHLLNHHDGHLDYLLSSTLESQDVQKIESQFSPETINLADSFLSAPGGGAGVLDGACMLWDNRIPAAKVIWDESDNNHGRKRRIPALRIIVEDGELLLAGWTGMGVVGESWKRTILLELPWSVYAQSATLEQVGKLNPQFVVFSPDRYSVIAPVDRKRLTHSVDNLAATSICGAFMVGRFDDGIRIQTMRPWE